MPHRLELLAIAACAAYAGAAAHVAFVEHPARLASSLATAVEQWRQSVGRTPRTAALALVAAVAALLRSHAAVWSPWTWGAAALLAIVPYTNFGMLPTQRRLAEAAPDRSAEVTHQYLRRWGEQHLVRVALGIAALLLFLSTA
jgi:anthrone oxygenase-like protein